MANRHIHILASALNLVRDIEPGPGTIGPLPRGNLNFAVLNRGPRLSQEGTEQTYKLGVASCFVTPKLADRNMPTFSV